MSNLEHYINSKDPLSRDAALFLVAYSEEDDRVDYKQTVDLDSEKEWLGVTKDISAFANTRGGYLVFGVDDETKKAIGLSRSVQSVLKDANNIQLKINRHLEPDITMIRSKAFRIDGKSIVVIYIPQSAHVTHFIKKDGVFKYPSGTSKTMLHQGTFYVRRSASNHLADSRDLDDVIDRRVDKFRDALLDKVARVVKSPADSNLFILSKDPEDDAGERFIIEDSPDSIPVKGMSFTVSPEGVEEEIAAWSVLSSGKSNIKPPPEIVWSWYSQRDKIEIREPHKLSVFQFSLWVSAPSFYWLQRIENSIIRQILLNAIRNRPIGIQAKPFLVVASFLGKATYREALRSLGDYVHKIPGRLKKFPAQGPRSEFISVKPKRKQKLAAFRKEKLKNLNKIVDKATIQNKEPSALRRWEAQELDCLIYAQDDNYK